MHEQKLDEKKREKCNIETPKAAFVNQSLSWKSLISGVGQEL